MNAHQRRIAQRRLSREFPTGTKVSHAWWPEDGFFVVVAHTERRVSLHDPKRPSRVLYLRPRRLIRIP